MHELRCPSCRLRLWLYQGMGREVPQPRDCPGCRAASNIASDSHAEQGAREPDGDSV
jgi:hypothetical protein